MVEVMRSSKFPQWVALAGWGLIALAYLVFFVSDLRLDYLQLQSACQGPNCNYLALSPAEMQTLAAWGLSPRAFALIMTGMTMACASVWCLLSGILLWRQGASRIGWAISLALIVMPVTVIADANNLAANIPALFIPSVILSQLGFAIFLLFMYLFPNGRFYPRWAFIPLSVTYVSFSTFSLWFAGLMALPAWVYEGSALVPIGLFALTIGLQILRYRRVSTPLERQQTKWVLLGFAAIALSFPVWILLFGRVVDIPAGLPRLLATLIGWLVTLVIISSLPVTIAIAILRYRLWEIDLVIRRTLSYSALSAVLVSVYLGSVVVLQSTLQALTGQRQGELVTVLSTLAIAALFGPVQRRVQTGIDRRFFRQKYDAARLLAGFAASARDETDLQHLSARLVAVVDETMQPETVGLWLRAGETNSTHQQPGPAQAARNPGS
jgi:hypothetical protein